jgi:hypothetical protein
LLADTTVAVTDAGTFVYGATLNLDNGFDGTLVGTTQYTVGVDENGLNFLADNAHPTTSPGVTLVASVYESPATGFGDPTHVDNRNGAAYVGPNLTYGTVTTPEPSTYALLGLGVLAFALLHKRKIDSLIAR